MSQILHSLYGRFLGIDKDGYITGLNGIKVPALYTGPSGSETLIGGAASVTTPTTAQTVAAGGTSIFAATAAKTYNLAAPAAGIRKKLVATSTSTAVRTINLSAGAFTSTAISTGTSIAFNGIGQIVELEGLSTAMWIVAENIGATLS